MECLDFALPQFVMVDFHAIEVAIVQTSLAAVIFNVLVCGRLSCNVLDASDLICIACLDCLSDDEGIPIEIVQMLLVVQVCS